LQLIDIYHFSKAETKDKKQCTTELLLKLQRIFWTRNGSNTVYQLPVTKQNRFLPITIDEQQGLNKYMYHESRVIIAAIKTLIIRAIIAQNNKIIHGRLPDSQPVFMTHISD